MNFRKEITDFKKEEVNIVTDLIFNKNIESNEEIIRIANGKFVDRKTTEGIVNTLKVDGCINYEQSLQLNDVSIKPSSNSLSFLIQNGLYKPEQ